VGVTEAQLVDLPVFATSDAFSPLDKLVLEYAVAMVQTPVNVPDALFDALRTHFSEAQLVELTAAIAWENFRARFNRALTIASQGFSEGSFCALPEHHPAD
jgi:alkylhydroperoxidase family enzyme